MVRDAAAAGVPSLVIAGRATDDAIEEAIGLGSTVVSLSRRFGEQRARSETAACIAAAMAEYLESGPGRRPT